MAAYLIANIEVIDPAAFDQYRVQVAPLIARFGGRYLVRGGAVTTVEGEHVVKRLVVLEFDSMPALRTFYDSPEYAPLIALRQHATRSNVALVDGYVAPA